ncbi:uncharacterized protein EV422DRAFT_58943 [Fimicolochytrium jonesii]|uniref:uncharacterized protein n=1 Tax=Fimicolochytrium jonesii TaxID=1396493 RepID=UPI0022FE802C|nr:uncharacterized protein EV422DRAFT_58943 [Fimicolochytrium jonesii]KAI8820674.1 hypothetical protein EV422DRAFT_58943 [Fimicolochytrium jonesii]
MPAAVASNILQVPPYHGGASEYSIHHSQTITSGRSTATSSGTGRGSGNGTRGSSSQQQQNPVASNPNDEQAQFPNAEYQTLDSHRAGHHGSGTHTAGADDLNRPVSVHAHSRALAKIAALEKTIEFLQTQHAGVLAGLHGEVERLQNACSELAMKSLKLPVDSEGRNTESEKNSGALPIPPKPADVPASKPRERKPSQRAHSRSQDEHLLSALKTDLDALRDANYQKESEINLLHAEREIILSALAANGIVINMSGSARAPGSATVTINHRVVGSDRSVPAGYGRSFTSPGTAIQPKQTPVLPPIGNGLLSHGGSVEKLDSNVEGARLHAPTPPPRVQDREGSEERSRSRRARYRVASGSESLHKDSSLAKNNQESELDSDDEDEFDENYEDDYSSRRSSNDVRGSQESFASTPVRGRRRTRGSFHHSSRSARASEIDGTKPLPPLGVPGKQNRVRSERHVSVKRK